VRNATIKLKAKKDKVSKIRNKDKAIKDQMKAIGNKITEITGINQKTPKLDRGPNYALQKKIQIEKRTNRLKRTERNTLNLLKC